MTLRSVFDSRIGSLTLSLFYIMDSWYNQEFITRIIHYIIMNSWYILLLAYDDCTENPCEHICTNNNGSFTCSCYNGYELDENGRSCNGMYTC